MIVLSIDEISTDEAIILQLKIKIFYKEGDCPKVQMKLHSSLFKSYQQLGIKFWKCHQRKKKGKPVWQGWDINNIWEANFVSGILHIHVIYSSQLWYKVIIIFLLRLQKWRLRKLK